MDEWNGMNHENLCLLKKYYSQAIEEFANRIRWIAYGQININYEQFLRSFRFIFFCSLSLLMMMMMVPCLTTGWKNSGGPKINQTKVSFNWVLAHRFIIFLVDRWQSQHTHTHTLLESIFSSYLKIMYELVWFYLNRHTHTESLVQYFEMKFSQKQGPDAKIIRIQKRPEPINKEKRAS